MARKAAQYKDQIQSLELLQVGSKFPESLARQVPEILNCKLQQVFGMAEGLVNYTRLDDSDEQILRHKGVLSVLMMKSKLWMNSIKRFQKVK